MESQIVMALGKNKKERKKYIKKLPIKRDFEVQECKMMEVSLPSAGRWNVAHRGEISFSQPTTNKTLMGDAAIKTRGERRRGKMKLLVNGTNHRGEVIRAVGNRYNDNMVWHDSYSTQRKSFAQAGGRDRQAGSFINTSLARRVRLCLLLSRYVTGT